MTRRAITDNTLAAELTMSVSSSGLEVTTNHGDVEDLRSLLLDIRKFLLQEEPASFNAVANLLHQRLKDDGTRDDASHNRAVWNAALQGNGLLVDAGGNKVRAAHMLDVLLYAGMFHENQALVAEWDALHQSDKDLYRVEVNDMIMRMVDVVRSQQVLIQGALVNGQIDLA